MWSYWLNLVVRVGELHQVAARGGRLLPEDGHQGARGADLDRPAKRLLEGDVGELLRLDGVALTDDAVGEFAVRPLALRGQATLALAPLLGQALIAPGPVPLPGAVLRPDRAGRSCRLVARRERSIARSRRFVSRAGQLARFVEADTLDARNAAEAFRGAKPLLRQAAPGEQHEPASGVGFPTPT
ncbi:MAG TPA: hypothetical protein VMK12_18005 [Anaeromyxobacteraceae bacterium]|nr:hypothetical protein [Anaeromyxobacteraceae bacterium]